MIINYKTKMKELKFLGMFIGLMSMFLAWYLYDWKLLVIIFLALWGNNLEQNNKESK